MGNEDNNLSINVVIERISNLHADVSDLKESTKESMRDIANALNRLVSVEERQSNTNEAFKRVVNQLDKMDQRLIALEQDEPIKKLVSKWALAAVWGVVVTAAGFCAKLLGII